MLSLICITTFARAAHLVSEIDFGICVCFPAFSWTKWNFASCFALAVKKQQSDSKVPKNDMTNVQLVAALTRTKRNRCAMHCSRGQMGQVHEWRIVILHSFRTLSRIHLLPDLLLDSYQVQDFAKSAIVFVWNLQPLYLPFPQSTKNFQLALQTST